MKFIRFFPIFGYIFIVLVLFWPILFPNAGTLIFGDDIHRSYHFFRQFFHDAIASGEFPWWNPYLFSGEPLIANPSVAFWYPFNWLFMILPYALAYSIIIPIHIFIAMTGMYWLARKWLGREAAWIAGLTFGLSGFFMGRIWEGHIDILTSAPYVPIVFGLFWDAFEKKTPRTIVFASIFFAIEMFAGYQTMAYLTGWAIGAAAILFCIKEKSWNAMGILFLGSIMAMGIAALQIIPAAEFFRQSIRTYQLPYSWAVMGASSLQSLKLLVDPFLYGGPGFYNGPGPNYGELAGYIGKLSIILAMLSVLVLIKRSDKRKEVVFIFIFLTFFSLWVALAWNAPMDLQYILWKYIPFYRYLRIPSRHLILFVFSMSFLTGVGLSIIKHKLLRLFAILLIMLELLPFARKFITLKADPSIRHNKELVSILESDKTFYRLLPNFNVGMATRDALDFDAVMGYKIFSASGYDPAILKNYYEFIVAANKQTSYDVAQSDVQIPYLNTHSKYLGFVNIKYILVPSWFDSIGGQSDRFRLVLEDNKKDFWKLYENKNVLPRFFLVPNTVILPSRNEVAKAIRSETYDPATTILTTQQPGKSNCSGKNFPPVQIISYRMNSVELVVESPCNAYLATSEIFYPGWQATIDGNKTEIIENNLAFRALFIPEGEHTIVMWYNPEIFIISGAISFVILIICFYIWKKKG